MNVKNNPKIIRKPQLNRNNSERPAPTGSRPDPEGQQTYYEKRSGFNGARDTQSCSQPAKMRRRKTSCPVKFESQPETKLDRKLSRAKIQSYIPFTARRDEELKPVRKPSFLQSKPSRQHSAGYTRTWSETSPPPTTNGKESKLPKCVYSKLMEPYHRLTKHNHKQLVTTKQDVAPEEKHWRQTDLLSPSSSQMGEISPTMSTDSGLGECTHQPLYSSTPWIDNLARIVTGGDSIKQISSEVQKMGFVVKKQPRRLSQHQPRDADLKENPSKSLLIKQSESMNVKGREVNSGEGNCREVNSREGNCREVNSSEGNNRDVNSREVNNSEVNKREVIIREVNSREVNKVLTRKPSVEVPRVDSENNIRIPERKYSCLLDLVDDH